MKKGTLLLLLFALVVGSIEGYSFPNFSKSTKEKCKVEVKKHQALIVCAPAPFEFNAIISFSQAEFAIEKSYIIKLKSLKGKLDAPDKLNYHVKAFPKPYEENELPPDRSCNLV